MEREKTLTKSLSSTPTDIIEKSKDCAKNNPCLSKASRLFSSLGRLIPEAFHSCSTADPGKNLCHLLTRVTIKDLAFQNS